jgi:hypothetical protein
MQELANLNDCDFCFYAFLGAAPVTTERKMTTLRSENGIGSCR